MKSKDDTSFSERDAEDYIQKQADDFYEVLEALNSFDLPKLQELSRSFEGFPYGVDPWLGKRWIICAIESAGTPGAIWLLDQGVELRFRGSGGDTPLHACIDRENSDRYDLMRSVIAAGADVDEIGFNDYTPLHFAAVRRDLKAIDVLLAAGADPAITTGIDNYATPEEEARLLGNTETADYLKKKVAEMPRKPKRFKGPFGLAKLEEIDE